METYTPYEWLQIDAAVQYGHGEDKQMYADRLAWTQAHMDELETMEPEDHTTYHACVLAIRDAQAGIPSGYTVGLDAASSGPQLLSVLTRCKTGMKNTGVINTGKFPDVYTTLTDTMGKPEYKRKEVKYSAMPWIYGSKAAPEATFGDDVGLFLNTIQIVLPHAAFARNVLLFETWTPFAEAHEWDLPDHFHVYKEVRQLVDHKIKASNIGHSFTFRHSIKKGVEYAKSNAADIVQSFDGYVVREMTRRCKYDALQLVMARDTIENYLEVEPEITDRTKAISLVELEYLSDETVSEYSENDLGRLLEQIETSLEHPAFDLLSTHDEFRCLPNHVEQMRKHYRVILWELYHSNLLYDIVEQLTGKRYDNWAFDQSVADAILEADYPIN